MTTARTKTMLRYAVFVVPSLLILIVGGVVLFKQPSPIPQSNSAQERETIESTTPVSLTIDKTATSDVVAGSVPVTINIDSTARISRVDYHIDGQLFLSTYSFPYSLLLDTTKLSNGKHAITAKVFDTTGSSVSTDEIVLTVKNPSPDKPTIAPVSSSESPSAPVHPIVKSNPTPSKPNKPPTPHGDPSTPGNTDTITPSQPEALTVQATNSYQVNIAWNASTDDTAVANYKLYRDGQLLKKTAATNFSDFTVVPGNTYQYTVQASDAAGNVSPLSTGSSITLAPTSIWSDYDEPATSGTDGHPLELGVKFVPKANGKISGMKFYKASGDTGTHVASLWRASDHALLARGNFTGESASGWQTMTFDTPISVNANERYVASYSTSSGMFSSTVDYFQTSGISSQYLTALDDVTAGGNGVYTASIGDFPAAAFHGSNYWADVLFIPNRGAGGPTVRTNSTPVPYSGFPDETNTGIYGKRLPVRDRAPDFVRPGMIIHDVIFDIPFMAVTEHNTTFRNVAVRYSGEFDTGFTLIHLPSGVIGTTFEDSEIDGRNATPRTILGAGNDSITIRRSNIHSTGNAVEVSQNIIIEDSFIHDIRTPQGLDWHADGIQGGSSSNNNIIRGNTILLSGHETGAVNFTGGAGNSFSNILIENNLLAGGGYTIYAGAGTNTNFRIINNKFSTIYSPYVGKYNIYYPVNLNGIIINGNTMYETGAPADTNFAY